MDKVEFYKDLEAVLEKHAIADHFIAAIDITGEVRTSVRFGAGQGASESNYLRRKTLLGIVEDQKMIMYTNTPTKLNPPENLVGCIHGTPKGIYCLGCQDVVNEA
mgnify:FL=1